MAKSSSFLQLLITVTFIWMLVINVSRGDALTCDDVKENLLPCLNYVLGTGQVPSNCCSGLKDLVNMAKTKTDRQTGCSCIKSLAARATDSQLQRTQSIPKTCGVPEIPFAISPDVDCSKVE